MNAKIESNNLGTDEKCAGCGSLVTMGVPYGIFDASCQGSHHPVCDDCAREHVPELKEMLDCWQRNGEPEKMMGNINQKAISAENYANRYEKAKHERSFIKMNNLAALLIQELSQINEEAIYWVEQWGVCPHCFKTDGCLNIERNHYYVCHEHKVKWSVGSNLFSYWRHQDEDSTGIDGYSAKGFWAAVSRFRYYYSEGGHKGAQYRQSM